MASINDVFNELQNVNQKLDQLHVDGVSEISAINLVAQINVEAVKLLFHQTQQADTIICVLENISKQTCEILNQVTIQTQLQTRLRDDADALREIADLAYPQAALERQRLAELRAQIERCCPPQTPPPACTYAPCTQPDPVKEPRLPNIKTQPK